MAVASVYVDLYDNMVQTQRRRKKILPANLASQVLFCITDTLFAASSKHPLVYSQNDIHKLSSIPSQGELIERVNSGLLVVFMDRYKVFGCGLIGKEEGHPEIKERESYGKKGYGWRLLRFLEEEIASLGYEESRLHSMRFPTTLKFYKNSGYISAPRLEPWVQHGTPYTCPLVKKLGPI
jgi:hypothetical protein